MVHEAGFEAINMPKELGGGGFTILQQVLVQEQVGRVTNALALGGPHAGRVAPQGRDATTRCERWVIPTIRGEKRECYAITEEEAGSDVDAILATARRDGDEYVLNGVKWHVTSFNHSEYVFFQAKLTEGPHAGEHAMFIMDMDTPGIRVVRVPEYTHTIATTTPILAFEDVRVPATHLVGERGRRHGLRLRVVPVRAPDDRRALLRRGRAADRRRPPRSRRSGVQSAEPDRPRTRRSSSCWPIRSPSSGRRGS